jgi:hypothetical protein
MDNDHEQENQKIFGKLTAIDQDSNWVHPEQKSGESQLIQTSPFLVPTNSSGGASIVQPL